MYEEYLYTIKSISKDITTLTNINSTFINTDGIREVECFYLMPPYILQDFFDKNSRKFMPINKIEMHYDATTYTNQYEMNFIISPVKIKDTHMGYLVLGPYLLAAPTNTMIQDVIIKMNLPATIHHVLKQYYFSLELLTEGKVSTIMKCLIRMLVNIPHLTHEFNMNISHTKESDPLLNQTEDSIFNAQMHLDLIEKRYENENRLYEAVEKGDFKAASDVVFDSKFMFKFIERVPNNPLRSMKNLFFVYSALLRKAAEKGGVHPIYTDSVSGKYAVLIERINATTEFGKLYSKMLYEYCELVRTHSVRKYSPFVGKLIEYINLNLEKPLSLTIMADILNSTPSTISRKFKEEVGESVTDYINSLRIEEAVKLMEHKNYSLTQIALKVGYNDVNYFTKVFKKIKGCTPSEYKKEL